MSPIELSSIRPWCVALFLVALQPSTGRAFDDGSVDRAPIVSVIGCLTEAPQNAWTLVNATDPVPVPAGPPHAPPPDAPRAGKNRFKLIGVEPFNLPAHKNQVLIVQGLLIKSASESRVNVTSVAMLFEECRLEMK